MSRSCCLHLFVSYITTSLNNEPTSILDYQTTVAPWRRRPAAARSRPCGRTTCGGSCPFCWRPNWRGTGGFSLGFWMAFWVKKATKIHSIRYICWFFCYTFSSSILIISTVSRRRTFSIAFFWWVLRYSSSKHSIFAAKFLRRWGWIWFCFESHRKRTVGSSCQQTQMLRQRTFVCNLSYKEHKLLLLQQLVDTNTFVIYIQYFLCVFFSLFRLSEGRCRAPCYKGLGLRPWALRLRSKWRARCGPAGRCEDRPLMTSWEDCLSLVAVALAWCWTSCHNQLITFHSWKTIRISLNMFCFCFFFPCFHWKSTITDHCLNVS